MFLCAFNITFANAADPAPSPTWSNYAAAGGTIAIARTGTAFHAFVAIPADYRICHTSGVDPVTVDSPGNGYDSVDIRPGICACFNRPAYLQFRNRVSVNNEISGTYEAFKTGHSCTGPRLAVSPPRRLALRCKRIHGDYDMVSPGHWSALACDVPIEGLRASYRLCMTKESLVRRHGGPHYDIGWARVVVDRKLVNKNNAGETGQYLPQFSALTGDCIDLYNVNQIVVLIGPFPPNPAENQDPYVVDHVDATLQTIRAPTN